MTDDTTTIAQLKQLITEFKSKRGWGKEDPKDIALSLVLESAELLEHFQWITGEEVKNNPKIQQAIGEEMSDVVWWVLSLGQSLGIDVSAAFAHKIVKNDEKYPAAIFRPNMSQQEKDKAYYKIKAATRGGHPLYEEKKGNE
ncbi:MAG TPA: nucleotide pyrophosphohydrolase [Candidatus Saccharimonadia bacterium]|nr:nucleotide pyrophosphohydrolase [Candidatus Saccharimonadia bacterium]